MSKHSHCNESQNIEDAGRKLVVSDDELFSKDNNEKFNNKNIKESQGLISSQVIQECRSSLIEPDGCNGFFVANIPVVISEFEVEINCETRIELEYPAIEIKRVKKNVFITQSRLLPKPKKLFLKGFIRKNIEYAAIKPHDTKGGSSIRHMTFEVPFVCTTEIDYFIPPIINNSCCREVEIYKSEPCESNIPEKSSENYEYFNEKIYCKPVMARVSDTDIIEESDKESKSVDDKVFKSMDEKITLILRLKLLQNQDVNIYPKLKKSNKKKNPGNYVEEQETISSLISGKNQP